MRWVALVATSLILASVTAVHASHRNDVDDDTHVALGEDFTTYIHQCAKAQGGSTGYYDATLIAYSASGELSDAQDVGDTKRVHLWGSQTSCRFSGNQASFTGNINEGNSAGAGSYNYGYRYEGVEDQEYPTSGTYYYIAGWTLEVMEDEDGDGVPDSEDNCPSEWNPNQEDSDDDGLGDHCDYDQDSDGVVDSQDNCRDDANPDQEDSDGDGIGDACDDTDDSQQESTEPTDSDGDGVQDSDDECPGYDDSNDTDGDGVPDDCDSKDNRDSDSDGVPNYADECPGEDDSADADNDGVPDGCDSSNDSEEADQQTASPDSTQDAQSPAQSSDNKVPPTSVEIPAPSVVLVVLSLLVVFRVSRK